MSSRNRPERGIGDPGPLAWRPTGRLCQMACGHNGCVGEWRDDEDDDIERVTGWAEDGDVYAMCRLAGLLASSDPRRANEWDRRAAELGHLPSMYNLASRLRDQDLDQAKHWWTRAAEAGHVESMGALGWAWNGVSEAESRHWYRRAAEDGSVEGMRMLGQKLFDRDPKTARYWLELAADAGHPGSMARLANLLDPYDLWPLLKGAKQRKAQDWLEKAAELGFAWADARLAYRIVQRDPWGLRTDPSLLQEARWRLERAAEAGNADAMFMLGTLLSRHDAQAAVLWWAQAAELGHGPAAVEAGFSVSALDSTAGRERVEQGLALGVPRRARFVLRGFLPVIRAVERHEERKERPAVPPLDQRPPNLNELWRSPSSGRHRGLWIFLGWWSWAVQLVSLFIRRQILRVSRPLRRRRADRDRPGRASAL